MILSMIAGINRRTQPFGVNPQTYAQFGLAGHNGIDLTGVNKEVMEVLYSPFDGYVVDVGDQGKKGYGKYIRIRAAAPDGQGRTKEIIAGHMSEQYVKKGQFVYMLDPVGKEGNTGFSTAAHLHYGLRYIDKKGNVMNANNGFAGYVDFWQYMRFWTFPPQKEAYPIIVF